VQKSQSIRLIYLDTAVDNYVISVEKL
jgi:hypothetical protein